MPVTRPLLPIRSPSLVPLRLGWVPAALATIFCAAQTLPAQAHPLSVLALYAHFAPGQAGVPASANGRAALHGSVLDPDGAVIPGATITLATASGKVFTMRSGSDGSYTFRNLSAGSYTLTVKATGFATFVRAGIQIAALPQTIDAKLAIADQATVVEVTGGDNKVSIDQDQNASATVLKGKDLDALSDDPDELSNELTALAGPSAGPNGGQIYIDGFTGGQLPPKSSIREIRTNQNPFSAEYDRAGFGRVEVFTKPGTDKFHGSVQINGSDRIFNTGSPFISRNTFQPDYHTVFGFGSLTGPINKKASFTLSGSLRNIQDNAVVNPPAILATGPGSGTPCAPGQAGCTIFQSIDGTGFNAVQPIPQRRWDITPRVDVALGEKNTLTTRFRYEHNSAENSNIGNLDLFSTGFNTNSAETSIQISDTQIVSAKVINETRFEYRRSTSDQAPFSAAPTLLVQGAFTGGGNAGGLSHDLQNHLEVQNYTSVGLAKHFIRFGGRLRTTSEDNTTTAGANGTFTYSSIQDYQAGNLSQFTQTSISQGSVSLRATDLGLYAEDDWKIRPNLTFSYGLRFETQNYIHDQADFAPRLSVAYALGKKTVLRAGTGIFYDRFLLPSEFNVLRNNGLNQQEYILTPPPPSAGGRPNYLPADCTPQTPANCPLVASGNSIRRTIANNLRAPYTMQTNAGLDQQLFTGASLSVNYQFIRGVHQFVSEVANFGDFAPGTGTLYQYQSEGVFNQNQLVTNLNYRHGRASFGGYYILNFAKSDTAGTNSFSTQPGNLGADYGRASFDTRNRAFLFCSVTLPHLITLSPLLVATAGTPYNITTGTDRNRDTILNDRAYRVAADTAVPLDSSGKPVAGAVVKTLGSCGTFASFAPAGVTIPTAVNSCTGPAAFTLNLRIAKTFGFGETKSKPQGAISGGPMGAAAIQGGPGGRGPGGGGRGPGGANSGKRFNATLGAQVQNVFNVVDRSVPTGTLSSPSFGTSTQLAGSIFSSDSAVRRVFLQLSFSF